jgi:hypothetical protein
MTGPEKPLALDLHGQFKGPGENRGYVIRSMFDQVFQEGLNACILLPVHARLSMFGFETPWNTSLDRPCWGMPQQGLSAQSPTKFPDLRLQYPGRFVGW